MTDEDSRESKPSLHGRRLPSEPTVIFLLLAVAIFAYDALVSAKPTSADLEHDGASRTVVVTDAIQSALESDFEWLYGRPPNEDERRLLVRQWIDEEVVFRKALAEGLHLSDSKVRSHLVDKLRLLWGGTPEPPDEAELFEFYVENIEDYYSETRISFDQFFFAARPERPGEIRARLAAGERIVGDSHWLGSRLDRYAESVLRTTFGGAFYERLLSSAPEEWIGPLESPRGYHFVRVIEVTKPQPIPYAELRERLTMDYVSAVREERIAAKVAELRDGYEIVIEQRAARDGLDDARAARWGAE